MLVLVQISSHFPEKVCNLFTSRLFFLVKMDVSTDPIGLSLY